MILATMLTIGVTLALWTSRASVDVAFQTGSFRFSLGNLTWHSPTQGLSGDASNLASLVLGDGDLVTLDQEIKPDFLGSNLRVGFRVALPGDLAGKWHITDATGSTVVPTSGEAVLGDELFPGTIVGAEQQIWHVVVTIEMPAGTTQVVNPLDPVVDTPAPIALGPLKITAEQVRG